MSKEPPCHLVLSPHLDDAALSCGGAIHHWVANGEPVLVVTLMAGDPPDVGFSSFAQYQHASWGLPARQAYAERRAEERAALHHLGADHLHADLPDCIYRYDQDGHFYTSDEAIFGPIHPADQPLVSNLVAFLTEINPATRTRVYAPLGLGNHVDHQLVRQAAQEWAPNHLVYYEDFPYIVREGGEQALTRQTVALVPHLVELTQSDMQAKIEAISCYQSQIEMLFSGLDEMKAAVWAHGERLAIPRSQWAERFWLADADTLSNEPKKL